MKGTEDRLRRRRYLQRCDAGLASVGQDVGENFRGQAVGLRLICGKIREAIELCPSVASHAVVLLGGDEDRDVAVMALDADRFALGGVEKGGEFLLGVGGGDDLHVSII